MHKLMPRFSYVVLANPIISIMESTRAQFFEPTGYLKWGVCMAMIAVFALTFWVVAYTRLKKRLDFV